MSEPVTLARHGQVAVITIDNPPVNALSHAVRKGIGDRLAEAGRDDAVNAVVVHCTGRTFIAGADIREFGKPPQDPSLREVLAQLDAFRKPTVAAIHGTALGGGLETALCCHYRVAAGDAKLGLPEVKLGLLPGSGGTQRLPRLIGAERALDMITGGKPVDAATALSWGVIDVCTDTNLLTAAISFAEQKSGAEERPRISEREVAKVEDGFFSAYRKKIARRTRDYEAPERIVQCVEAAASLSFEDGMRKERELFRLCRDSKQSASMRYLFFAERQVARIADVPRETPTREINNVAVVGAGTMGAGIALSCLNASLDVSLLDKDRQGLERGRATIEKLLAAAVGKGRITDIQMQEQLSRLRLIDDYQTLSDADLVIEAVFESMAIKEEVFSTLDRVCRDGAILASNTSTLDIDRIAATTSRPEDVIGLHFFSPANVMKLLEIVRGTRSSTRTIASMVKLAKAIGKVGVVCGNCDGFVANRSRGPFNTEMNILVEQGATPEQVDRVMYAFGYPMGPFAVADLAGGDIGYAGRKRRAAADPDYRKLPIADRLVEQGRHGQKNGAGWYRYEPGDRTPHVDPEAERIIAEVRREIGVNQRDFTDQEVLHRMLFASVNEACKILQEGIAARASDVDVMWLYGFGFPRYLGGLMYWADQIGVRDVYDQVRQWEAEYGERWKPAELLRELAESGRSFADA
ncbi:MAG: 3-hydroxyacyl-CoA dehydrogenase NAD-binding domain-containing protein [Gammaproteobacteria bacterium]|nr:3-hydroxyacyl-CoA dehydrogenase NAD-binding domain-containing protein [Gammaproteobacteria bacterium]